MFALAKRSVGLVCLIVVSALLSLFAPAFGKAETLPSNATDLLQSTVTVTKLAETSTDVALGPRCTNMTVQVMRSVVNTLVATPEVHCMISTSAGFIDNNSTIIEPIGMAKAYPLKISHGGQPVILPVEGSAAALFLTNDTAYPGLNVGIYYDLFANLTFSNNPFDMKYTLNGEPDTYLRYSNGRNMAANMLGSILSYSSDGRYMVIDGVFQGFTRVDLLTQKTVTFADDLPKVNDTGLLPAATAVSASGQYAAVAYSAPGGWGSKYLKIIDVNSCATSISSCKTVDVFSQLKAIVPTLGTIDRVDFASESSLLVTARYDFDGQKSKEGQFAITPFGQTGAREEYLAMGDSYISGEGAGDYLLGTDTSDNKCHQSLVSYPYLIGKKLSSFASVACSGAVIDNIRNIDSLPSDSQLGNGRVPSDSEEKAALDTHMPGINLQEKFLTVDNPQIVTVSIGGNDIGFADIINKCIVPYNNFSTFNQNCYQSYEERAQLVNQINAQFNNLYETYTKLKENAPTRKVYVVGYPQIVNPAGSCGLNVHLSKGDAQFAGQLISYLDSVIAKAAAKAGVNYVDIQHAFDGHLLCDEGQKAVNGLTKGDDRLVFFAKESYHPNAYGHELLADYIAKATNNLTTPMPTPQNIANPTVDASLPILQMPHTNSQVYNIENVNTSTEELLLKGSAYTVPASSSPANLAPNSAWSAVLYSTPLQLGTVSTNAAGIITGTLSIPSNTPAGFHTIHYYGKNIAGEPIDIQDVVYVAASANDYDGDGVLNSNDSCPSIPQSDQDEDKDGIDDACDGSIGPAPSSSPEISVTPEKAAQSTTQAATFLFSNITSLSNNTLVSGTALAVINNKYGDDNVAPQVLHAQSVVAPATRKQKTEPTTKTSNILLAGAAATSLPILVGLIFYLARLQKK